MSQPFPSADEYAFSLEPTRLAKCLRSDTPLLSEIAGGKLQVAKKAHYAHIACGFFAYIYRVKTAGGNDYALRCPRSRFPSDSAARYQALAGYLQSTPNAVPYLAKADHFDDALFVSVRSQGIRYPVQVMEWIAGKTLLETVTERVAQNDKAGLRALAEAWEQLLVAMKAGGVIHADLHPENVIVDAANALRLVDYDTLIVPGFTPGATSAGGMMTYFHPGYARAGMPRPVTPYLDDFGAVNILLSLRALAINPAWRNSSEYLLFNADDIESPATSVVFMELLHYPDSRIAALAEAFFDACCAPTETGDLRVESFVSVTPMVPAWATGGMVASSPSAASPVVPKVATIEREYEPNDDAIPTSAGKVRGVTEMVNYVPQ